MIKLRSTLGEAFKDFKALDNIHWEKNRISSTTMEDKI